MAMWFLILVRVMIDPFSTSAAFCIPDLIQLMLSRRTPFGLYLLRLRILFFHHVGAPNSADVNASRFGFLFA